MGQQFSEVSEKLKTFISQQKIFFVGTAADAGRVNISPKGMDSLRVLTSTRIIWLNVTGSGNETAAHVQQSPRMTLMFMSFEAKPLILRLYGIARVIHQSDPEWSEMYAHFSPLPGARQLFELTVDLVQTSCGMSVPFFNYVGEREQLNDWAVSKGEQGIKDYWLVKNQNSLDGFPTHIARKNL